MKSFELSFNKKLQIQQSTSFYKHAHYIINNLGQRELLSQIKKREMCSCNYLKIQRNAILKG